MLLRLHVSCLQRGGAHRGRTRMARQPLSSRSGALSGARRSWAPRRRASNEEHSGSFEPYVQSETATVHEGARDGEVASSDKKQTSWARQDDDDIVDLDAHLEGLGRRRPTTTTATTPKDEDEFEQAEDDGMVEVEELDDAGQTTADLDAVAAREFDKWMEAGTFDEEEDGAGQGGFGFGGDVGGESGGIMPTPSASTTSSPVITSSAEQLIHFGKQRTRGRDAGAMFAPTSNSPFVPIEESQEDLAAMADKFARVGLHQHGEKLRQRVENASRSNVTSEYGHDEEFGSNANGKVEALEDEGEWGEEDVAVVVDEQEPPPSFDAIFDSLDRLQTPGRNIAPRRQRRMDGTFTLLSEDSIEGATQSREKMYLQLKLLLSDLLLAGSPERVLALMKIARQNHMQWSLAAYGAMFSALVRVQAHPRIVYRELCNFLEMVEVATDADADAHPQTSDSSATTTATSSSSSDLADETTVSERKSATSGATNKRASLEGGFMLSPDVDLAELLTEVSDRRRDAGSFRAKQNLILAFALEADTSNASAASSTSPEFDVSQKLNVDKRRRQREKEWVPHKTVREPVGGIWWEAQSRRDQLLLSLTAEHPDIRCVLFIPLAYFWSLERQLCNNNPQQPSTTSSPDEVERVSESRENDVDDGTTAAGAASDVDETAITKSYFEDALKLFSEYGAKLDSNGVVLFLTILGRNTHVAHALDFVQALRLMQRHETTSSTTESRTKEDMDVEAIVAEEDEGVITAEDVDAIAKNEEDEESRSDEGAMGSVVFTRSMFDPLIRGCFRMGDANLMRECTSMMRQVGVYDDEARMSFVRFMSKHEELTEEAEDEALAPCVMTDGLSGELEGSNVDVKVYDMLMQAHSRQHRPQCALRVFARMIHDGVEPSLISYRTLIHVLVKLRDMDSLQQAIETMQQQTNGEAPEYSTIVFLVNSAFFSKNAPFALIKSLVNGLEDETKREMEAARMKERGVFEEAHGLLRFPPSKAEYVITRAMDEGDTEQARRWLFKFA